MPNTYIQGSAGSFGNNGSNDNATITIPATTTKVYCIVLGAGGGGGPRGGGDPHGGGGGGGGLSAVLFDVGQGDQIVLFAGGGGRGSTDTGNGDTPGRFGNDSYAAKGGSITYGRGGNGGETFGGGAGGNGNIRDGQAGIRAADGSQGGGAAGRFGAAGRNGPGVGGNGVSLSISSSGWSTNVNSAGGSDGANRGGGGGGRRDGGTAPGGGGGGFAWAGWVTLSVSKTTLRSGEPVTVSYNDASGSTGTVNVSFTNNGSSNTSQTYTYTDSFGAAAAITFTILPAVSLSSFSASPNPQLSDINGVPSYSTTLSWTASNATSYTINQGIGAVSGNSTTVNNLPQSTAGSNSPSQITYTLTASDGFNTASANVTVNAYNDNSPSSISEPSTTTSNVSLSSLEPNTQYRIAIGPVTGIDMGTLVSTSTAGVDLSVDGGLTWSSSRIVTNNGSFLIRFTSLGFNSDPSGLTNSKTITYSVGTSTNRNITVTTRAPDVNETFDLPNVDNVYPFPDIDTVSNTPTTYIVSPRSIDPSFIVDDVEVPVEIKTNNPNVEIRIKPSGSTLFGSWQSTRQKT